MVSVHGAVTLTVAPSTSCAHCTWLAGERSVRRLVVPLIPARARVVRPELVCDTHRDAVSVTRKLQYAASDVRVGERCHKVSEAEREETSDPTHLRLPRVLFGHEFEAIVIM